PRIVACRRTSRSSASTTFPWRRSSIRHSPRFDYRPTSWAMPSARRSSTGSRIPPRRGGRFFQPSSSFGPRPDRRARLPLRAEHTSVGAYSRFRMTGEGRPEKGETMRHGTTRRLLTALGAVALIAGACSGGNSGGGKSVTVIGTWGGDEQKAFLAMVAPWEQQTGN